MCLSQAQKVLVVFLVNSAGFVSLLSGWPQLQSGPALELESVWGEARVLRRRSSPGEQVQPHSPGRHGLAFTWLHLLRLNKGDAVGPALPSLRGFLLVMSFSELEGHPPLAGEDAA